MRMRVISTFVLTSTNVPLGLFYSFLVWMVNLLLQFTFITELFLVMINAGHADFKVSQAPPHPPAPRGRE